MERALTRYPNRFELTMLAAARAKELNLGEEPSIELLNPGKPVVVALEEVARDLVVPATMEEMDKIREFKRSAREQRLMAEREAEAARQAEQPEPEGDASEEVVPEK